MEPIISSFALQCKSSSFVKQIFTCKRRENLDKLCLCTCHVLKVILKNTISPLTRHVLLTGIISTSLLKNGKNKRIIHDLQFITKQVFKKVKTRIKEKSGIFPIHGHFTFYFTGKYVVTSSSINIAQTLYTWKHHSSPCHTVTPKVDFSNSFFQIECN